MNRYLWIVCPALGFVLNLGQAITAFITGRPRVGIYWLAACVMVVALTEEPK